MLNFIMSVEGSLQEFVYTVQKCINDYWSYTCKTDVYLFSNIWYTTEILPPLRTISLFYLPRTQGLWNLEGMFGISWK